jgi:hypothetical protein
MVKMKLTPWKMLLLEKLIVADLVNSCSSPSFRSPKIQYLVHKSPPQALLCSTLFLVISYPISLRTVLVLSFFRLSLKIILHIFHPEFYKFQNFYSLL